MKVMKVMSRGKAASLLSRGAAADCGPRADGRVAQLQFEMVCERPHSLASLASPPHEYLQPILSVGPMTVRKKENRKQRTYGPSSLKGGDYADSRRGSTS